MPPIGWYIAQGLSPLGYMYDSSDDEEGPTELPDGRLVCGSHGLVVCYKCCVDFSFMEEVLREAARPGGAPKRHANVGPVHVGTETSDAPKLPSYLDQKPEKGTGRVIPNKFVPPSTAVTPPELFSGRRQFGKVTRLILPNDGRTGIIYTDGACSDNGRANPKAGFAFWHGLGQSGGRLVTAGRLEKEGPFGEAGAQTSNRAELRAVIAALRFRHWPGEGFRKLVIATDSEYVVEGATNWVRKWIREDWTRLVSRRGRERAEVKNKDMWLALLGRVEKFKDDGMAVEFWRIPRQWNTVADTAAKDAAASGEEPYDKWTDILGMAY